MNVLLQVIEYVKYLQEKVQKYEGSFPGWGSETTNLMPWVGVVTLFGYFAFMMFGSNSA